MFMMVSHILKTKQQQLHCLSLITLPLIKRIRHLTQMSLSNRSVNQKKVDCTKLHNMDMLDGTHLKSFRSMLNSLYALNWIKKKLKI